MKILLAVDGSPPSLRATTALLQHIQWFREPPEIHLLHVHPPIPIGFVKQHVSQDLIDSHYREEGETALAPARQQLDAARITYQIHLHVGDPAELIVKLARQFGCDLICIGTHGRGGVSGMVLGSVAHKVLHLSERTVLFAK